NMTTIMSLSHFELFRILDYMKWNCERQHSLESVPLVKYLDIFNFASSCRRFRRVVLDWSEDIYYQLGIDPLQKNLHKHLTVPFNEIHSILKRTTKKGKENFIDIYISAMMKELTLNSIEMTYKPQENIMNHDEIFEKLLKAVRGEETHRRISDLGLFRHISKLNLTASFEIADLVEFCKQNQGLVSLDINVSSFADHRKLSEIVGHCPLLKQLKFVLNDNAGDNDYVRLANLDRLQQLEIVKPPSHAYIIEDDEGFISKRPRIENEIEALSEGINQSFESNVAVHELLKAISVKKRSLLANLTLKFNVEDEILQTIAKIKSIRILECGICNVKSINHLKDSPVLKRLVFLNKGHLISDDIVHFLKKQVKVSSLDTEISLHFIKLLASPSASGHLYIETKSADIYRNIIADPLLNIENLQLIYLSDDLIQ
ncbi:hypothetical protein KR067_001979, partial [Drosophila pandora]